MTTTHPKASGRASATVQTPPLSEEGTEDRGGREGERGRYQVSPSEATLGCVAVRLQSAGQTGGETGAQNVPDPVLLVRPKREQLETFQRL